MELKIKNFSDIKPSFDKLLNTDLSTIEKAEKWLKERGELYANVEEELAWRYIKMTTNTENKQYAQDFQDFVENIEPKFKEYFNLLNSKLLSSPVIEKLKEKYPTLIRSIRRELELFKEENLPLLAKESKIASQYGQITGKMTVKYNGKELTLQQASVYLTYNNRNIRKEIFYLINQRREKDKDKLNKLLNNLIEVRTQIAKNAGFNNYRDFKHQQLERFDYTIEDVLNFHKAIEKTVVPLMDELMKIRKKYLKLKTLKPWDLAADITGKEPLRPFSNTDDFIEKTYKCLKLIKPKYADYFQTMANAGYLDLESRKGKAPGGYNYPLLKTNIPFIFMNASGQLRDVVTLLHETGHAIHAFLTKDIPLVELKETPSEVAELASMSMELISMEHWDVFFKDPYDLARAKLTHLDDIIKVLPWIATIDKFQHLLYTNPKHTTIDRYLFWGETFKQFSDNITDWYTAEWQFLNTWQKQLHIYEVPFYYIEYAFAQLGAIAIWRNYKNDPQKTIEQYENALKLGYSKTIPEIYKTAGIYFNFSEKYIAELMNFVFEQIQNILYILN